MPELGSKISLISKADIRYEGKLFTVDPQDCTIALASGKMFFFYFLNNCFPFNSLPLCNALILNIDLQILLYAHLSV